MERPRVRRSIADKASVVVLGAGNVATHLCGALSKVCDVKQIWSRNKEHAQRLAETTQCGKAIDDLADIDRDADFYIISVPDNAIASVVQAMPAVGGIVAHTSGSVGMEVLAAGKTTRYGVFYPLQTFSRQKAVNVSEIPFFIEGSDDEVTTLLMSLAERLTDKVYKADSKQRATLHIAAVFACNFANHLWGISADILAQSGYSFDVFKPLLQETLRKAFEMGPTAAQTGPAKRGDMNVINGHLAKLDGDRHELYELITKMILNNNHE
jgi:predicted short-subunit dehydrogenase-like oxidoreductase (DUF2520 family)